MGAQLMALFGEAEKLGGVRAKLKLAGLTKMTSAQANTVEDTPEMVAKFQAALQTLAMQKMEPKNPAPAAAVSARAPAPAHASAAQHDVVVGPGNVEALRKQLQFCQELTSQRSLLADMPALLRRIDEAAVDVLEVARASVWFLDGKRSKISCADLFERNERKHSSGTELLAKDFPAYFAALEREKTIAAHDAHTDSRTSCFSEVYLKPLGINSMLDVPIWATGWMTGVLCLEHDGPARSWNADDERFAYLLGGFVALAAERGDA
jgi:hypothetical protein